MIDDRALHDAVDYWCNAFTPDRRPIWQRAIANQGLSLKVERDGDEFCTAHEMARRLDRAGFATVILVAAGSHAGAVLPEQPDGTPGSDNFDQVACSMAEVAALHRDYPGRFVASWSVDPSTGTEGVDEASAALDQPWCVALHNHTHSWNRPFDHRDFTPFYDLCAQHDVPFIMQAGESGGRFPSECGHPGSIQGPAADYSGVDFVLSHTGWPWTTDAVAMATEHANVYLGTASWPLRRWPPEVLDFAGGSVRTKVLYASGFPTTGHAQAARQFADPDLGGRLGAETIARVTSTYVRRVFTRLPTINPTSEKETS